jgi:hypothetical protein
MNDWAELDRALGAMTVSGRAEVREDGEWFAELGALRCELHTEGKNPLVRLWSSERNLTRRVLHVREQSNDRIVLEVRRFGRAKPGRLEFIRTDSPRPVGRVTREQFRARLSRILAECFPDALTESLTAAPDLEHSFSGVYVRGRMREGSRAWALLAASPGETSAAVEGILAFGILWLDWTRAHARRQAIDGLRLFVPEGAGRLLRERVSALSPAARTEIFEFREADASVKKMDLADGGNVAGWLLPRREAESTLNAAQDVIRKAHPLALHTPPAGDGITTRLVPGTGGVALCFRGLEFGRWSRDGLFFGLEDSQEKLSEANELLLDRLVRDLDLRRSPLANEVNHPLYRKAPERWLETLLLEDPTKLDAHLDPRFLYSQVPALTTKDRGVLDLLGVTRQRRLVVIEIKASEDIQMPVQAVDYWQRVRRHQQAGDFERCGYFSGVELDPRPPLVWLVAPSLRFHPATDTLLRYFSPEIHFTRIGVNESWRHGLKIIFRH